MKKFSETFRKDVTYDNIKSHIKPSLQPVSRRHIFGKAKAGGQIYLTDPRPFRLENVSRILKSKNDFLEKATLNKINTL